jgi:chemotaxis protein MotB
VARRKKQPAPENHERWLVSYADFITLLFAFFVVMFASVQGGKSKANAVSESVRKAFEEGKMSAIVNTMFGGAPDNAGKGNAMMKGPGGAQKLVEERKKDRQLMELMPSLKVLSTELNKEIEKGTIKISMEQRGLTISFKEATLFASGEDVVSSEAYSSINKVAEAINKLPNPVRLEGHTDSVPIHTARFRSNWELSAARSIALLEIFATKFEVPRERMSIAGYADTAPIDSNDTLEGRSRNRRCDIIILNETGALAEPGNHAMASEAPAAAQKSSSAPALAPPDATKPSPTHR